MTENKTPQNVCIFGLSANPPTGMLGHQGIVKKLIEFKKFDEIWVLPVYRHMYSSKRSLASFEHRLQMCKLNFEKLSTYPECRVIVKPTERTVCLRRMKQNPQNKTGTADILDFLQGAYPTTKFSFAMGADSYLDLVGGKWNRAEDLAKYIDNRFIVVARDCSTKKEESDHEALDDMIDAQNAKANTLREEGKPSTAFGATLSRLPSCEVDVSSTQVRQQLIDLEEIHNGVVDEDSPLRNGFLIDSEVLGYCRSHHLFRPKSDEDIEMPTPTNSSGGMFGGWGKWLIILPTVLALALAMLGVSYSPSSGLVLPPMLGGAPLTPLLTMDNVEELTSGKVTFVKFMAPWCGHCKHLKPTWDSLASSVNQLEDGGVAHVLVADVDCTSSSGRPLCEAYGIEGFPTLKFGDFASESLEDYDGGRELSEFKKFVEQLSPPCTPDDMDKCSLKDQAKMKEFLAFSSEKLNEEIAKYEAMKKEAASTFEQGVNQLKAAHRKLIEAKDKTLSDIRNDGLNNARAVLRMK
mmetsp:Transcript_6467/g.7851  ORF Transcript_6467/g.7851 Transcript_6467/m.7851 type:complete len:521 (-) Transcript_6467:90-1652(-)